MTDPRPLTEFREALLASPPIRQLIAEHCGEDADELIAQIRNGDLGEFEDLFEDNKIDLAGEPAEALEGAAPYDNTFPIVIWKVGPVFWVSASEFDDSGYFGSLREASSWAGFEYGGFILALAEREADEEKPSPG